ncbi:hypothetical protein [Pseudomonas sp. OTU5201]|uniref:hypothetical protein n=1 Tax=Pseudomonas sp. OTU5201 TaxID=3043850 RepID=UPI00313C15A3
MKRFPSLRDSLASLCLMKTLERSARLPAQALIAEVGKGEAENGGWPMEKHPEADLSPLGPMPR